jgi:3-phosphoshikimate 1-carboxyvinyltransferase
MNPYPASIAITPLATPPHVTVTVPGSKSITNRALVLAALCSRNGPCTLTAMLRSDDTEVMLDCLTKLGFRTTADWATNTVTVHHNESDRIIPATSADLFVGNSGTTVRFLTAAVSLSSGEYRLDGVARMRERPIQDLLDALAQLGVEAVSKAGNGCPPVVIRGIGWQPQDHPKLGRFLGAYIESSVSSQFLSGLMMACPFADGNADLIYNDNLVSRPYLEMTADMLSQWGIRNNFRDRSRTFPMTPHPNAHLAKYHIEPDASSASYFFAAAAITGGQVTVRGMKRDMLQGDVKFVDCLQAMGCGITDLADGISVRGGELHGIDVDMNAISDTVMTLAAVACFADGPTTIRNVAHIRHKETDRIAAVATELRKLGAEVEEYPDGLRITPKPLRGCAVDTYDDHRMAMSLALVGLKVPDVVVNDPGCVAKTYPGFWDDLSRLANP